MLIPLFEWFRELGMPGAAVMNYATFRAIMAFIISLIFTLVFGSWFIKKLKRKKVADEERDLGLANSEEKKGTPTMGGIIICAAILIPVLLFCNFSNVYILLLIISTIVLSALGFIDDYIKVFKHNKKG